MSLNTSYGDENKVVSSKLAIRYSVVPSDDGNYYTITRTASMNYAFIGMDEDTATSCGAAKVAQYTRNYSKIKSVSGQTVPSTVTVKECKTSISVNHTSGAAWDVNISVNETDVKASATAPADPASLFTAENARNYDGGGIGNALEIDAAIRGADDTVCVDFSENISEFDEDRLVLQYKTSESGEWTRARSAEIEYNQESRMGSAVVENAANYAFVRLIYGFIESAAVAVEDEE